MLDSIGAREDQDLRVLLVENSERPGPRVSDFGDDPIALETADTLGRAYSDLEAATPGFDAVLLDARLPDGDASDALDRLRALAPTAAILVLAANEDDEGLARWTVERGAHGWLPTRAAAAPGVLLGAIQQAVENHHLLARLRASESRCRRLINATADGVLIVGDNGAVLFCNPAAEKLFRCPASALCAEPFGFPLIAGECVELDLPANRVAEMRVAAIDWDGESAHLVTLRDVTERHRSSEALRDLSGRLETADDQLRDSRVQLERAAFLDSLTGLLNRRGLERTLSTELARTARHGTSAVAILIDCDDFEPVNETLGHAVGDVVLATVANRLAQSVRPSDHVARVGGDEFLVLLPDTRLAEGLGLAERVRLAIAGSPLILAPGYVNVTASFGVALIPSDTSSIEEVLVLTRMALQRSKRRGKNQVATSADPPDVIRRRTLGDSIRHGSAFRAVSHPIIELETGRRVGVELLSRGPAGAFHRPIDFFRVALEERILTLVDLTCLKTCLVAARDMEWGRFHVNLLPSTILDTPAERLVQLFPRTSNARRFCIEISEQQLIGDPQGLRDHLSPLRDRGLQIAVDDVGFGRSCLESLVVLEPDVVKIDRSCVSGVSEDPAKQRQLKRLLGVTRALDTELVAEGIETIDELSILKDLGVTLGQGFLWGAPE